MLKSENIVLQRIQRCLYGRNTYGDIDIYNINVSVYLLDTCIYIHTHSQTNQGESYHCRVWLKLVSFILI